jgi:hypothetical protein
LSFVVRNDEDTVWHCVKKYRSYCTVHLSGVHQLLAFEKASTGFASDGPSIWPKRDPGWVIGQGCAGDLGVKQWNGRVNASE